MSYGGYSGYGYSNYRNDAFARDYNGDGLISASDFREGAYRMGYGQIGADVAQSAFNALDRNRNGYLDVTDANRGYGYIDRLYR